MAHRYVAIPTSLSHLLQLPLCTGRPILADSYYECGKVLLNYCEKLIIMGDLNFKFSSQQTKF